MGLKEVRHLEKCIRKNIQMIQENKLKDYTDIESLKRFCAWIYTDSQRLIEEWKESRKVGNR